MHPALDLKSLRKLSFSFRKMANTMTGPELPSPMDHTRFMEFMRTVPENKMVEFLPVYYHMLNPAHIPSADALDAVDPLTRIAQSMVLMSMGPFLAMPIPFEVGRDLWPRVWAWMSFLYTFEEFLYKEMPWMTQTANSLYPAFIKFCYQMWQYTPNQRIMASTPGCAAVAVRAWACFSDRDDFLEHREELGMIRQLLVSSHAVLHDALEPFNGDVDKLARLVMQQCNILIRHDARSDAPVFDVSQKAHIWLIENVFDIVAALDQISTRNAEDPRRLCSALMPLGFLETASQATLGKHRNAESLLINNCIMLLVTIFQGPEGKESLRISIGYGLLNVILSCAKWPKNHPAHPTLYFILDTLLPRSTVFYYSLATLGPALVEVGEKKAADFSDNTVYEAWKKFWELGRERLRVLLYFDRKDRISSRACDNVECGRLALKKEFKCCSGCSALLYCSQACQIADWRMGHRESCIWHLSSRNNIRVTFSPKEISFMRFLLDHNYSIYKGSFLPHLVTCWVVNADATISCLYDYCVGKDSVPIMTASDSSPASNNNLDQEMLDSRYYADMRERARRSKGRMSLDVMRVPQTGGLGYRDLIVPLRRETGRVDRELRTFAANLDANLTGRARGEVFGKLERIFSEEGMTTR
ncbi:hypothetical protein R3P38DRAFT_2891729 [Favolaschia claudopus]|uniref:phytol kinase n=1 Tax=Favolaschia claudopus TaxID=2862362 RepID=A0AAW0CVU2_9AGAR